MDELEVYQLLLEMKDTQIVTLSNYINWLIAIAAVIVSIVTIYYGWLSKKMNNQRKEISDLIHDLKEAKISIEKSQQVINQILNSADYLSKVETLEKAISKISVITDEIQSEKDKKAYSEKIGMLEHIRFRWRHDGHFIKQRINNDDKRDSIVLDEFVVVKSREQQEEYSFEEIKKLYDTVEYLYSKYHSSDDPQA